MKNSIKREPNISNIEIDDKGEITIESVNIREPAFEKTFMISDGDEINHRDMYAAPKSLEFSGRVDMFWIPGGIDKFDITGKFLWEN